MRKILATTSAALALFAHTSAQAANGCYGCNIADERVLNASLIGTAVYYNGARGVAENVDPSDGTVYLRLSDGRSGWASARDTYTSASYSERQTATGVAAVGVIALLAAAIAGSSSSSASRSPPPQGQRSYRTEYRETQVYSPAPPPPASSSTTSGFYGNCHGGAAYGCN